MENKQQTDLCSDSELLDWIADEALIEDLEGVGDIWDYGVAVAEEVGLDLDAPEDQWGRATASASGAC